MFSGKLASRLLADSHETRMAVEVHKASAWRDSLRLCWQPTSLSERLMKLLMSSAVFFHNVPVHCVAAIVISIFQSSECTAVRKEGGIHRHGSSVIT